MSETCLQWCNICGVRQSKYESTIYGHECRPCRHDRENVAIEELQKGSADLKKGMTVLVKTTEAIKMGQAEIRAFVQQLQHAFAPISATKSAPKSPSPGPVDTHDDARAESAEAATKE